MPLAQITLTPAESKRIIAKGVIRLPEVRRALRSGTVVVCVGTTNGYVAEELGVKINKSRFIAGVVLPKGTCALPRETIIREIVLKRGKRIDLTLDDIAKELGTEDVVIKGANALDPSWTAGVFVGSEDGGTVGKFIEAVESRGVKLVIPVGLEKLIPNSLVEVSKTVGIRRCGYAIGLPVGITLLRGRVMTEIDAIGVLTGSSARSMGGGGVSGAEGSVTLAVSGTGKQMHALKRLIAEVKGEPPLEVRTECDSCGYLTCFRKKRSGFSG